MTQRRVQKVRQQTRKRSEDEETTTDAERAEKATDRARRTSRRALLFLQRTGNE